MNVEIQAWPKIKGINGSLKGVINRFLGAKYKTAVSAADAKKANEHVSLANQLVDEIKLGRFNDVNELRRTIAEGRIQAKKMAAPVINSAASVTEFSTQYFNRETGIEGFASQKTSADLGL